MARDDEGLGEACFCQLAMATVREWTLRDCSRHDLGQEAMSSEQAVWRVYKYVYSLPEQVWCCRH